jgi:L-ascorbate metabolism protein UlaG (beta-lactamase superfamily)
MDLYPGDYDLVLVPVGFTRDIFREAANFVTLLNARRVIPMHYWDPGDRDRFLELLEVKVDTRRRSYRAKIEPGATISLTSGPGSVDYVEVVGLTPGPYLRTSR